MTRKELEYKERLRQRLEIRRKVIGEFFVGFTKYFRPWLHELTRRYKELGDFPVMACWLLPSYYTDARDIKVAAFVAQLIKDDEKVMERVDAFRSLMGESPWEWFRCRVFVSLSIGRLGEATTGGVGNSRIAEYMNMLYESWPRIVDEYPSIFDKFFGVTHHLNKERVLRLILAASDGFSLGVWTIMPPDIKSPLTGDVFALLRTFFPDYKRIRDVDMAVKLFGFDRDYDFFYAALAYKELQRRNPKGCSRLATLYQKRYSEGNVLESRDWIGEGRGILPEIKFD